MDEDKSMTVELIDMAKTSAKRWFIISVVELIVIMSIVGGFLWYNSLPADEYQIEQETGSGGDNYNVGGNYNGISKDNEKETSDTGSWRSNENTDEKTSE